MTCAKTWVVSNRYFPGAVASNPEELKKLLGECSPETPKRIYFPFWSWKVPIDILARYECIGFHSAPLPFGRGGSPIQNMIKLGHRETELCAFRMTSNFAFGIKSLSIVSMSEYT